MGKITAFIVALSIAHPAFAEKPLWARTHTKVVHTKDYEDIIVEVDGIRRGLRIEQNPKPGKKPRKWDLVWERDPLFAGLRHRLHPHEVTTDFPEKEDHPDGHNPSLEGLSEIQPHSSDIIVQPDVAADTNYIVDVNMFYTDAVAAANGGVSNMPAFTALMCASATQGYANSAIPITFRCNGPFRSSYPDNGNLDIALDYITVNGGGAGETAAAYSQTGADLTQIVIRNDSRGYCGLGYINSTSSTALSSARDVCLNSGLTGAHETGHNMGFNHDPKNSGCTAISPTTGLVYCAGADNYGHLWPIGATKWRTIMAYPDGTATRVTYFSNPNILYNGYPTGVVGERNNARTAIARAAVVSGFRRPTGTFPVPMTTGAPVPNPGNPPTNYVTVPPATDYNILVDGSAVVTGYTINWARASDGVITTTTNCGHPTNGNCSVPIAIPGTVPYTAQAISVGPGGSSAPSAKSVPFTRLAPTTTHKPGKVTSVTVSQQ